MKIHNNQDPDQMIIEPDQKSRKSRFKINKKTRIRTNHHQLHLPRNLQKCKNNTIPAAQYSSKHRTAGEKTKNTETPQQFKSRAATIWSNRAAPDLSNPKNKVTDAPTNPLIRQTVAGKTGRRQCGW